MRHTLLLLALLLTAFTANANDLESTSNPFSFLKPYDGLLSDHVLPIFKQGVNTTGVDYKSWSEDTRYLESVARLGLANTDQLKTLAQKLSFWINAYNLLTIHLIIKEGETESIQNLGTWANSPWKAHKFNIGGNEYTLDQIEHKILRPKGDPRIHFAINCASLSCPQLRHEAYSPERINGQLDEQTLIFLTRSEKGLMLDEKGTLYLSKIFKWFKSDFETEELSLIKWLNQYVPVKEPTRIKYIKYNWQLNNILGREVMSNSKF